MASGCVYANVTADLKYALGYVNWYDAHMPIVLVAQCSSLSTDEWSKALVYLKDENFHFAARIRKTHHTSIPLDVILMKLKHFIKEQLEEREKKLHPKAVQLEFDFVKDLH